MNNMTHLSPQQQRIFNLLQRADKLIGNMMPGIRYIALQDYAELNNVPLDIGGMLRELSEPDLVHEVGAGSNTFPLKSGPGHPAHNDVMEATAGFEDALARSKDKARLALTGSHDEVFTGPGC